MAFPDQSDELRILDSNNGYITPDSHQDSYFKGLIMQLQYFNCSVLE